MTRQILSTCTISFSGDFFFIWHNIPFTQSGDTQYWDLGKDQARTISQLTFKKRKRVKSFCSHLIAYKSDKRKAISFWSAGLSCRIFVKNLSFFGQQKQKSQRCSQIRQFILKRRNHAYFLKCIFFSERPKTNTEFYSYELYQENSETEIVYHQKKMNKICIFLFFLIALSSAQDCFGEGCAHRSVVPTSDPVDPVQISTMIEQQLRRQYWYYLENADLIYQANLNMLDRQLVFYFHRNMVGTFFTIASWNFLERYSEVNTMVRLGNGYPSAERTGYEPVAIEPFIITLRMDEGEVRVELSEHLQLDVNGQIIDLNDDGRPIDQCGQQSDSYLRANYWYYLNNAVLLDYQTLTTNIRQYSLLTYSNRVGTFLVISSCEGDQVKANTFVRLGAGSETPDNIVLEPIILQMQPF